MDKNEIKRILSNLTLTSVKNELLLITAQKEKNDIAIKICLHIAEQLRASINFYSGLLAEISQENKIVQ